MLSSHVNLQNITNLYNLSQTGQVSVPVTSGAALFSNFNHINGVSVHEGDLADSSSEISVSQLHIINRMIQRLYKLQERQNLAEAALEDKLREIGKASSSPEELRQNLQVLERQLFGNDRIGRADSTQLRAELAQKNAKNVEPEAVQDQGSIFDIVV
ncbi:hypothetical protein P0082_02235 [Candidatus Haliotispira prima]|uniref:Uncharacterized protein n=1 Tax=Candidatus Haliotispira prima TaxID=3034016 RepID=A0ABY8MI59_9SPIO|nr:hypothetical protein P0082_02235 [Candidatus Haliotispira prima]